MAIIICKLKLFNFFFLFFNVENDGIQTFPLRDRALISRKRNILVVNDSASKGKESSKFMEWGEGNRRTTFKEREDACEGSLNREEWVFHHLPPSLAKRKMERSE